MIATDDDDDDRMKRSLVLMMNRPMMDDSHRETRRLQRRERTDEREQQPLLPVASLHVQHPLKRTSLDQLAAEEEGLTGSMCKWTGEKGTARRRRGWRRWWHDLWRRGIFERIRWTTSFSSISFYKQSSLSLSPLLPSLFLFLTDRCLQFSR